MVGKEYERESRNSGEDEEQIIREFWQAASDEEKEAVLRTLKENLGDYRLVEFVSSSAGRGKRRNPREVHLFKDLASKVAWQLNSVQDGKRKRQPRRNGRPHPRLDSIAEERLGKDASVDDLLDALRKLS